MLHFSTKTLRLLKKVTKMLDNAYHTKAFFINFNAEKHMC